MILELPNQTSVLILSARGKQPWWMLVYCVCFSGTAARTLPKRTPAWNKMKEVFKWSFTASSDDEDMEPNSEPEE